MSGLVKKELHVILHGQTARFRAVKYLVLVPFFAGLYWWKGGEVTLLALGACAVLGVVVHLFFR